MIVAVPKETVDGEKRVALIPERVQVLVKAGAVVRVEVGAGEAAGYPDAAYAEAGAELLADAAQVIAGADVVLQVNTYAANRSARANDLAQLSAGQVVIGLADPLRAGDRVAEMAARGLTVFGLEMIPRITRAQAMDVLSSMATITGYKAVLSAADRLPRFFPMLMTAAGTVKPARVFVIGAGVAGLQAIATAKRLGAVVSAYDVRPEVAEQVHSVGGKFLTLALDADDAQDAGGYAKDQDEAFYERQRALMAKTVGSSDVVITSAAIPGRQAPTLITAEMVATMPPGSVIVDLVAEYGGNCELSRAGETVVEHGVTILGPSNLAAEIPFHASQMFARNLTNFLGLITADGALAIDMEDEIVKGSLLCHDGSVVHPRLRDELDAQREVA